MAHSQAASHENVSDARAPSGLSPIFVISNARGINPAPHSFASNCLMRSGAADGMIERFLRSGVKVSDLSEEWVGLPISSLI